MNGVQSATETGVAPAATTTRALAAAVSQQWATWAVVETDCGGYSFTAPRDLTQFGAEVMPPALPSMGPSLTLTQAVDPADWQPGTAQEFFDNVGASFRASAARMITEVIGAAEIIDRDGEVYAYHEERLALAADRDDVEREIRARLTITSVEMDGTLVSEIPTASGRAVSKVRLAEAGAGSTSLVFRTWECIRLDHASALHIADIQAALTSVQPARVDSLVAAVRTALATTGRTL